MTESVALASAIANFVINLTHPLEVVRTRLQSSFRYEGVFSALALIKKEEGLRGLFRGWLYSYATNAIASAIFFSIYEHRKARGDHTVVANYTKAAAEAAFLSSLLTQPFWVVKTRLLLSPKQDSFQAFKIAQNLLRVEGVRGFYRGMSLSLLLSTNGMLQILSYQLVKWMNQSLQLATPTAGFLNGTLSKVLTTVLLYPLTTIRTRRQQEGQAKMGEVIATLVRERAMFRGLMANMMKGVLQKGIYFCCYQTLLQLFKYSR